MDLALKLNVLAVCAASFSSAQSCWERSEFGSPTKSQTTAVNPATDLTDTGGAISPVFFISDMSELHASPNSA